MKKNLEILGVEDTKEGRPRVTEAGKPYARIKISEGWMSCFNKKVWETLRESIDKIACVEVKVNGKFNNIDKYYGPENVNLGVPEEEKSETSPVEVKPKNNIASGNQSTTMYVSYAKDLAICLINQMNKQQLDVVKPETIMNDAIKLIEQAKKAFS